MISVYCTTYEFFYVYTTDLYDNHKRISVIGMVTDFLKFLEVPYSKFLDHRSFLYGCISIICERLFVQVRNLERKTGVGLSYGHVFRTESGKSSTRN